MGTKNRLYPFSSLLQNVPMLSFFDRFLQENFSGENLSFWFEVERYKKLPDNELQEKARDLYFRYIKPGSVSEINVDCEYKTECKFAMEKKVSRDLFLTAQQAIFEVMQTDSYPKFLRSETYQQYLQVYPAPTQEEIEEDRTPLIPCAWTWFCHKLATPNMKIQSLAVSPPSATQPRKVWGAVSDGRLISWKASPQALQAEKLQEIQAHPKRINSVTSIGSQVWCVSDDSTVSVWNSDTGEELKRIELPEPQSSPLLVVIPQKRGNVVYIGSASGHVYGFSVQDFAKVLETQLPGPAICLYDDGQFLWVGSDQTIYLLDSETLSEESKFLAHNRPVRIIIESIGRLWTCSDSGEIYIWARNGTQVTKLTELNKHQGRVTSLFPVHDSVWSGSFDKTVIIWDADTFQFLQQHTGQHTDSVRCVLHVDDGVVWVSAFDRHISIWHYFDAHHKLQK